MYLLTKYIKCVLWGVAVQYVLDILWTKKGNIRKYTTFCGGINEDGERKTKKIMYLSTKYIKCVLWGLALHLEYFMNQE